MVMVLVFVWIAIVFWTVHWATLNKINVYTWALFATIAPPFAVMLILLDMDNNIPARTTYSKYKKKKTNVYKASISAGNPHYVARKDSLASKKRVKASGKTRVRHTHDEVVASEKRS